MENTVEQGQSTEDVKNQATPKTFTQDEVNAIIKSRLHDEKSKYADYEELKAKAAKFDEAEEANKSELQKATERVAALEAQNEKLTKEREITTIRQKVSSETGVPSSLLFGATEEECQEQAKSILEFAKPGAYPQIKDGGEVHHTGAGTAAEEFAAWFQSQLDN